MQSKNQQQDSTGFHTAKKTIIFAAIAIAVIALLAFGAMQAEATADVWVDDDADPSWYDATHVRTVQEGVDNASAGDTVYVYNGTYVEQINVTQSLTLEGESNTSTVIEGGFNVTADNTTITHFNITTGYEWDPDGAGRGGAYRAGIYATSSNNTFSSNHLNTISGGGGDDAEYDSSGTGGDGGVGAGIYLQSSTGNNISSNQITGISGGGGGDSGSKTQDTGGDGGVGAGIYLQSSTGNNISSNQITSISGGGGGDSNSGASGGTGGVGAGIYLQASTDNNISSNQITGISGGRGGDGYHNGADQVGYGIYMDDGSLDNQVDASNLVGGEPVIYLYNESQTTVEGYTLEADCNPTNYGKMAVIESKNVTIHNNSIANITGRSGDTYNGVQPSFPGGVGAGIYLQASTDSNISSNTITEISGGEGGSGSADGDGGDGGVGAGIYLQASTDSNISSNTITNISSGEGGSSGEDGSGGTDGVGAGIYFQGSAECNVSGNIVTGNKDYGVYLSSSTDCTIYNNYFNNTINAYDAGDNNWNISKTVGENIIGGPYIAGNYWSDYNGTDDDGDGLGDTNLPYNSSGNIQHGGDLLPLVPPVQNLNTSEYFYSIQAAIDDDDTLDGHTIKVAAGTYNEQVTVDISLVLNGVGASSTGTVLEGSGSGTGITVAASDVIVQDLRLTNYADGIELNGAISNIMFDTVYSVGNTVRGMTIPGGTDINNLVLEGVSFSNNNGDGIRASTASKVDGFTVSDSHFDGNSGDPVSSGMEIYQNEDTPGHFKNVLIEDTTFNNNGEKGIYTEKLSHATFDNITVDGSGTSDAYNFNAGIDINLKYADYEDITIKNSVFTGCGEFTALHNGDDFSGALQIKARDDGSYSTAPATLTDVTVEGNEFISSSSEQTVALRFGEPGAGNAGPTNVEVHYNNFDGGFDTYALWNAMGTTVNATYNYWGAADGPSNTSMQDPYTGQNATGSGDALGGNGSNVHFDPWLSGLWYGYGLVHDVTQDTYFGGIQDAIDAANENDTIKVNPGEYRESLTVNKSLQIVGDPVINANGSAYGVHITANDTLFQNYTVYNYTNRGIYVHNASHVIQNVTIDDCTVTNSTDNTGNYGIYLEDAIDSHVNNSHVQNNTICGIHLESSDSNNVSCNYISSNKNPSSAAEGIHLWGSDYNDLTDNKIYGNDYGISFEEAQYNAIFDNKVYDNDGIGIVIDISGENDISSNEIYGNVGDGIVLQSSSKVNITFNQIENNTCGICLESSSQDVIMSNSIKNNSNIGIAVAISSSYNEIANNILSNSDSDLSVSGSPGNVLFNNTFSSYPTTASFTYSGDFTVSGVENPPEMPDGVANISKFLDITVLGSWVNVTLGYDDSDLSPSPPTEDNMTIWKHDTGIGWEKYGGWYTGRGIDTTADETWANITDGSIFAPLQDTEPPSSSLDILGPYWNNTGQVTLDWNASDNVGLSHVDVYQNYSSDNASWTGWSHFASWTASGTSYSRQDVYTLVEGWHRFAIRAVDEEGNVEWETATPITPPAYEEVAVDTTDPVTTKIVGSPSYGPDDLWVNLSTNITLPATDPKDNASGVAATYYRIWNSDGWHPNATDDSYCTNQNITVYNGTRYFVYFNDSVDFGPIHFHEECVHYLEFFSVDHAGNEEVHTNQTHYVDDTSPDFNVTVGGPNVTAGTDAYHVTNHTPVWVNATDNGTEPCIVGSVNLTVTIEYQGTEIYNESDYVENAGDWAHVMPDPADVFADNCTHYMNITAIDDLGNTATYNVVFYVDNMAPDSSIEQPDPYCRNVTDSNPLQINGSVVDLPDNVCASGVYNVSLWYRYARYNHSFTDWIHLATNTTEADDWQYLFTAPNGSGYYQFYTAAYDNLGHHEQPPTAGSDPAALLSVSYNHTFDFMYNTTREKGWNWVTLPVKHPNIQTVSDLASYINTFQENACNMISVWDPQAQQYRTYVHPHGNGTPDDFTLKYGQGVMVHVQQNVTDVYMEGCLIEYDEIDYRLYDSWNVVGWTCLGDTDMRQLGENISDTLKLMRYDPARQAYRPAYFLDNPEWASLQPKPVEIGQAVFLMRYDPDVEVPSMEWQGGREFMPLPP